MPTGRDFDGMPEPCQPAREHLAVLLVVVDDKDGAGLLPRARRPIRGVGRLFRLAGLTPRDCKRTGDEIE